MNYKNFQIYFFLGILAVVFFIVILMFLPYLSSLVIAATLAIIFEPVHNRIFKIVRRQKILAALITILAMLVIVLVPITFFGIKVFNQAQSLYLQVSAKNTNLDSLDQISVSFEKKINSLFPKLGFSFDINESIEKFFKWFFQNIGPIFSSLAQIFTNFLLSLIALYYIFKDGQRLKATLFRLSPLNDDHNNEIFAKLKNAIGSVIRGSITVAVIQGVLAGTGFAIFGIPNAALWGFVTVGAALIPIVGTAAIRAPAIGYLFLFGNPMAGV